MVGRLPARYRAIIWVVGLASFAGVGAWVSFLAEGSTASAGSLLLAAATAVPLGALFVHGFLHVMASARDREGVGRAGPGSPLS